MGFACCQHRVDPLITQLLNEVMKRHDHVVVPVDQEFSSGDLQFLHVQDEQPSTREIREVLGVVKALRVGGEPSVAHAMVFIRSSFFRCFHAACTGRKRPHGLD